MESAGQRILDEIAAEKKELRIGATLTVLTLLGLLTAVFVDIFEGPTTVVIIAYVVAYLAGGLPATKEAFDELKSGTLSIDLLMVLAALAAAAVGEPRDGAILLFLFSLAETLEGYAMGNTKRSIAALMELRPDTARRVAASGEVESVAVDDLVVGDVILVRPGERFATDGEIVEGIGAIDQSSVTGESVPIDKEAGDQVFAGSLNVNVVLKVKVTKPVQQSTLARMIELVTEAREQRSPSERFSNWFGERYTIVVLVGSALSLGLFILVGFPFADAAYRAATLLVVASPCAIVISVPAAVLSALATAARNGVLFKGGAALEDFGSIKAIAFDKTGTLTHGVLEVTNVVPFTGNEQELLQIAATVETNSDHPLALSVVHYAASQDINPLPDKRSETLAGKGIVTTTEDDQEYWVGNRSMLKERSVTLSAAQDSQVEAFEQAGKTPVLVGVGDSVVGVLALADTLRETAGPVLAQLRQLGVAHTQMLTGDTAIVANAIGKQIGLASEDTYGNLLPEDKVDKVKELRERGSVAFVGDGVNDAAALANANVGIAMGAAGSDVAIEAADVALLSDDLQKLTYTYKLSRQANRIIKQNLFFAVGIMLLMVVITIFWYLPLPLGVIGHEGGTLLVVANSLRLLFMKIS